MLRSVYTKTLRDLRWGVVGWGIGLGALLLATAAGWAKAYPDALSRARLATQINAGGLTAAQVLYGPARNIDQLGGFVEWRVLGLAPVLLGLYLILSATGAVRGAEESHTIEVVAATPTTRSRLLVEQACALATALVLAVVLVGAFAMAAGLVAREPTLRPLRVVAACANVAAAALLFGAGGLLASQFFERRRSAALAATGAMMFFHFANTLPLAVPGLHWVRFASPLYLYTKSSPLADGGMNWPSFLGLLAAAATTGALALAASQRRDLFDTCHLRRKREPAEDAAPAPDRTGPAARQAFLRNGLGRGVRDAAGSAAVWAAGLSALAVLLTALTPNMRQAFLEQPTAGGIFSGIVTERSILSALVFSFLIPPLVAVFGVTLAASWAGDEMSQRLELELATPVPRWKVFAQRLVASIVLQATVVAVMALVVVLTIESTGIDVPISAVGAATAMLIVLAASAAAIGFALVSWRPGIAAAGAGGFVAVSYFGDLVLPLLGLPAWVRYFTLFGLYGSPLADGVIYWHAGILIALTVAAGIAGAAGFERKDIAK